MRQLATTMSPTARLLDFLAYKYNILFIISAGNHPEIVNFVDKPFDELKALNISQRSSIFGETIKSNQRNLKILAPAESLNGLTIGALYDDFTNANETARFIWAVDRGLPSPVSAIGKGYRSVITPDLFYYGGREFIRGKFDGKIDWVESLREPGCLSAAPYGTGDADGCAFSFGTSDAAAQITHEAAKCHDVLNQVFIAETGSDIPVEATAILLKAMLTHGAYRGAQLWFNIDDSGKGLVPDRQNTEWQAVRKGSLQHEIFIGENPIVWNDDDLIIKVNCKEEANKIKTAIPYCLFVSFEVAEGFDVNLYADVSAKIHQRVQISNN